MRTIDSIQSDIIFLSKRKDNFLTRIFNSNKERISELRIEEAKAIDLFLYTNDNEYKKLADLNIELLRNTQWKMKVTEYTHGGRNLAFTTQIKGEIQTKGYAYGNRVTGYSLLTKNPSKYVGKIDYLGKITVDAIDNAPDFFSVPKTLKCFTNAENILTIEKDEEENSLTYDTHIKSVMGDPFNGDMNKRQQFLSNRQALLKLIADKKI